MELSIVIPIYNMEQTLGRCIESVLEQSFHDYEILLVDDGSMDNSSIICDEYSGRDSRIKVFHKNNGGLSSARNLGIVNAVGKYITFIDSDDKIAPDTLFHLMETLHNHQDYDILEYPVYVHYGSSSKQKLLTFQPSVYRCMTDYWFETKAYQHTYAWNKIYKRELFCSVSFPEGRLFEDVFTLPKLLDKCMTIATTDKGLYYYFYNDTGITSTAGAKELKDLLDAHIQLIDTKFSCLNNIDYYSHVLNIQMDVFELSGEKPILPKPHILHHSLPINKITLINILNIRQLCQLNKFLHKIYRRSH